MILRKYNKIGIVMLTAALSLGLSSQSFARPDVNSSLRPASQKRGQFKTTASCRPAEASIDLDINNVRARLMTGGDMWWDNGTSEARYEVPKGTRKNALFAGSVWIGGYDEQDQLKVAAQTYRQTGNDYWPGALDPSTGDIAASECSEWDRFWKIDRETITRFRELSDPSVIEGDADFESLYQWPAKGNENVVGRNQNRLELYPQQDYAPFVDVDNDGEYDPLAGDYPDIKGDQYIWWVFNDKGNVKQQSNTEGIGIEVQASAFAYSTKDFLNDATFYQFRLINRGTLRLDSTYIATWTDADLGYYRDDYIGCDTARGLGILYNGRSVDGEGQVNSYGDRVPMVGVDFFEGPIKYTMDEDSNIVQTQLSMEAFTYYNNDNSVIGNPNNGIEIYNYMTGSIRNGQRFSNDFKGPNVPSKAYGEGTEIAYVFTGDPKNKSEWSECACNNPVNDRRFVHSSGPFVLDPGVVNDITIGAVWVSDVGGCPNTSFSKIRVADDLAQDLFDRDFQTIEGPEAPRLVVKELDRKLAFYLVNDPISNNYQEKYGRDLSEQKYRVASNKAAKVSDDSLYKFQGYRVYQLANRNVTPADILNEDGSLNSDVAQEIFQCDIKDSITRIINYDRNTEVSDSTFVPVIRVEGVDSGIRHSFSVEIDQFAQGEDKRFVNYKSYYFVAVAYAYNNFADFNPKRADSTQDVAYLESSKGAGGIPIPVVVGMPNPANGDMGTVLNSDFGDGVIIKRIEGRGNGGLPVEMTLESEMEAVQGVPDANNPGKTLHQSLYPNYKRGSGPIDIKVVDPANIKPYDWELYITGNTSGVNNVLDSAGSEWRLVNITTNEEIYGERDLSTVNEQILEKFGFSIEVSQAGKPGDDQINGNGLIFSNITFSDPSNPWLAGVQDEENRSFANWIRSGNSTDTSSLCNWDDNKKDTTGQFYESMLDNFSSTTGTWAPYGLASDESKSECGFGVTRFPNSVGLGHIPSVDIVFTSDRTLWSRCIVFELQDDDALSEGGVDKFAIRDHASWTGDVDGNGRPLYSTNENDRGFSWFPGYAVSQETGERLNIMFGEDSWLVNHNGNDMIWNPTSTIQDPAIVAGNPQVINGGKHYIYIDNTKYDSCRTYLNKLNSSSPVIRETRFNSMAYVGLPIVNEVANGRLSSIADGIIPNETRIRIRVTRPYATYNTSINGGTLKNDGKPLYEFSTRDIAPTKLADNSNANKDALLDRIHAVPNPYYGYTAYEQNRYDTRVRIINLPARATVSVYSLDGSLIRRLEKDNPNVSYIDWDIRNTKSLPIASGMYLIHVNAEGIGETVIRWFGAMRPLDVTNF